LHEELSSLVMNMSLKNVLIVCVDSLRPEALKCYPKRFKYKETFPWRISTPTINHIAREGVLFSNCIVQAPFTPASHASFFTGLNPPSHGIRAFFGYKLLEHTETLAERLKREGYHTAAIIGADALDNRYGLDRSFDIYDVEFNKKMAIWAQEQYRRLGSEATERALAWLQEKKEPFFLFMHYFDVHDIASHILAEHDYVARVLSRLRKTRLTCGPVRKLLQKIETFYGQYQRCGKPFHVRQVRKVDREIGKIIRALKDRNLYNQTMIIITSDHGDAFGEHGEFGHRKSLYDTTLRVPLILKGISGHEGKVISNMVCSIDLLPTIYELLGLAPTASVGYKPIEGKSLLPLLDCKKEEERIAYSETRMEKSLENTNDLRLKYIALRTPRWKLIINMLDDVRELYDVANDPGETCNVIAQYPDCAESLGKEAMRIYHQGDADKPSQVAYTEEELDKVAERLKDLGYL
jgi:arylsulfatase A-like enzyme